MLERLLTGDYALDKSSPYRLAGSDGFDLGADIAHLPVAAGNAVVVQTQDSSPPQAPADFQVR